MFNEVNKMEDSQEREKQNIEKKEKDVYFFSTQMESKYAVSQTFRKIKK